MSQEFAQLDQETFLRQDFFRSQGFLRIPDLLTEDEAEEARLRVAEHLAKIARGVGELATEKSTKSYQAVQNIPGVMEVATNARLLDNLEGLLGPNISLVLNRHNHATTNPAGSEIAGLHRDHGEWSRGLLSAIVYLEDADIENGCTHVIPGSHKWPSLGRAVNGGYWLSDTAFDGLREQAVPVPMKAGGVLVFDAHMYHGVGENTSDRTRTSIALGYHSVDQLALGCDSRRELVVRGEDLYRGNDQED